jgi:putative tricarboxylic transport membrane protein
MNKVIRWILASMVLLLFIMGNTVLAADRLPSKIRIIVPGGPGGGWDTTARETAKVLLAIKTFRSIDIQNIPGAGGGKGIKTLINEGKGRNNLILVNSTPILLRYLNKTFPESFRDLTPLAATIADFQAIAVRMDSPFQSLKDLGDAMKKKPGTIAIAGGSSPGSMDHISAAMVLEGRGVSWRDWNYVPAAKGGGDAMTMLLASKHIHGLSTGASEVIGQMEAGKIRVLCITSSKRLSGSLASVPTGIEQGFEATFVNWRGFFGPPGMSKSVRDAYAHVFGEMQKTAEWEQVRAKYGWANNLIPGDKFYSFLEKEEAKMKKMLIDMGFMK